MGLPYHAHTIADSIPLPQVEPTELVFDAYPMSYVFKQGHRIRVTITGGEKNTYHRPSFQCTDRPFEFTVGGSCLIC